MGIFRNIKDKAVSAGKTVGDSIRKPTHERKGFEKVLTPVAGAAWAGGKGAYRMVMGSPFPEVFRKIRHNISRRSFVPVENHQDVFVCKGQACRLPKASVLTNSTVIEKNSVPHLRYNGKDYRLNLIEDEHEKEVGKGSTDKKLYRVFGFKCDEKTVVYIDGDKKLDTDNADELIYLNSSNTLKAINFAARDRVTGETDRLRTLFLWPFALTANILKLPGAIVKATTDTLHETLSKASTRLINTHSQLQGLEAQGDNKGRTKMKAKIVLGKSIAVCANVINGIGDTTNNLSGFLSAVVYSPSVVIDWGNQSIVTSYLKHTGKDLLNGLKQSSCEVINPCTISLNNPSGKFVDVMKDAKDKPTEYKNTVNYGAKSILSESSTKEAADLGALLKKAGFAADVKNSTPLSTKLLLQDFLEKSSSAAIAA